MPGKVFSQSHLPTTQRSLPMALLRARENVMAPIRAMLSASGLTEQQWRLLRVLSESGPLEATILANRAALLLPSQTRIVQSMEKRGLVFAGPIISINVAILWKSQHLAKQLLMTIKYKQKSLQIHFRMRLVRKNLTRSLISYDY